MITYREDAFNFYDIIKKVAIAKAISFSVVFGLIYGLIFGYFLQLLRKEIWQTNGMISMIPNFVLKKNVSVMELVWNRSHMDK